MNATTHISRLAFGVVLTMLVASAAQAYTPYVWDPNMQLERFSYVRPVGGMQTNVGIHKILPDYFVHPRWMVSFAHEDRWAVNPNDFEVGETYGLWINDLYSWPNGGDGYECRIGIDNWNNNWHRDKFHFTGINYGWAGSGTPSGIGPALNTDFRIGFRVKFTQTPTGAYSYDTDSYYGGVVGDHMIRCMVGLQAIWDGKVHVLEINLWRTDSYNWVTTNWNREGGGLFDSINVYDRRTDYGTGECCYVNGANLNALGYPYGNLAQVTSAYQWYEIDAGWLFRNVAWVDYPDQGWSNVTLTGAYVGVEMFGASTSTIKVKHLNVWTP